jgi:type III restriction enzyme
MRFNLKDFQETAVANLLAAVSDARGPAAHGRPQTVVLASPTGSGKTAIVAALMERVLCGHDGSPANPRAVFLWLSDAPELNEQSRTKILEATDGIPPHRVQTIEVEFNQERLSPGHVYFLNIQKLGTKGTLTQRGDGREWTIWETIENTAKSIPDSLYLVIDEAHRGMRDTAKSPAAETRAESTRITIVQKFIKGDAITGLSPIPMIIGVSATPERFNKVLEGTSRAVHPVTVSAEDVRESGLIKDKIKLDIGEGGGTADWALLAHAGKRAIRYTQEWAAYCKATGVEPPVEPVLVVQVENGDDRRPTHTDLATALQVLERVYGDFPAGALAHCFDEAGDVQVGTRTLRKLDASKVQQDRLVKVVFFKTALSTGWDCPRAEVMMSFRKASDHTLIAQLVGRMVRTPLARRIENNEFLNGVSLALPHYDDAGVKAIVEKLQNPETGSPVIVENERDMVEYRRDPAKKELFDALVRVPTYSLERRRRKADSARLIKLARMLDWDTVADEAGKAARNFVVEQLKLQAIQMRKDPSFANKVSGAGKVPVREFVIDYGRWKDRVEGTPYFIDPTPENIREVFDQCGSILGEGLHWHYWRAVHDHAHPDTAKLELRCILEDKTALNAVQDACAQRFDELYRDRLGDIENMPAPRQKEYSDLRQRGGKPSPDAMVVYESIEVRREGVSHKDHLYTDEKGNFGWDAKGWEKAVLDQARKDSEFAGFLRNIDRKPWALSIPYGEVEAKPVYPDLLVFRRAKGRVSIDILDPHGDYLADALVKAKGLAKYAAEHGELFGKIEVIRVVKDRVERLDLQNEKVRLKVLLANTVEQLRDLYSDYG